MQEVTNLLGFSQAVFVPPVGTAGGICFGWKPGVDIEPTFQSQNLINLLVFSDPPNKPWMLSAIYGPPYKKKKRKFWEDMHQIASSFSGPWLCFGDFNEVLNQVDKRGGRPLTSSSTNGFNSLINQQGLVDLGFSGNPYTWTNKRHNFANIKERLDRAFSNTEWRTTFPRASVHHFPATSSDHNPIILNSTGFESTNPKPFRFEAIWTRDGSSTQVIKHAWDHLVFGSPLFKFIKKLKATKKDLIWWNKNCFGHLQTRNKSLSEAINSIQQLDPTESNLQKEKTLTWEFNENLRREDLLWKQKSRVQWLTTEIKQTLFSIGSNKSPGPDGMSAIFYKHYWEVINHDLIEAVTSFFTRGHILTEINHTFITSHSKIRQSCKDFSKKPNLLEICMVLKISPSCTPISHLQFADDLLIFSKANSSNASIILDCLSSYQAWSGQKINYSKSSVIFSKNTTGQTAANLCQLLNLKKSSPTTKHLGLPLELNRAKSSSFQDLIEKIQNRVAGWKIQTPFTSCKNDPHSKRGCIYTILHHVMANIRQSGTLRGSLPLENFIPSPSSTAHPIIHRVAELINPDTFQWDRGKISTFFDCITASKILNIHLSPTSQLDKLCWVPNSNGILSVKSAYLTDQNERFISSGPLAKSDWKILWKAKISPRHKQLLWKIAWDILPTKAILVARIPASDTTCHLCNDQEESALHIFTQCPITLSIWLTSPWPIHPNRLPLSSISDWVSFVLNPGKFLNLQLQEAQSFTLLASVICDQIWFHRNKMLKSGQSSSPPTPPPLLAQEIHKSFLFHKQAWEFSSQHPTLPTHNPWSPPPPGWLKINFDAAVRPNNVFLAAVCRNHLGKITHAWNHVEVHGEALWAEAKAGLFAVSSALDAGLDSIIF
uniref:Uncharacterized protein n=1 Tax=Fagus sylvatica TaxID=28930 RepID=A0A2N9HP69_FAGSY